jgi:transcriptional regulator with XRE-family HTH domain
MKGEVGEKGMPGYKKGQIVATRRGRDGQPIMFTDEPLTDQDTWDQLQEAIKAGARARGQAQSRHMLYRVLFCRTCSPTPFNPETAVRMYGGRRHTTWREVRGEHVQYISEEQVPDLGAFILEQRKRAGLSLVQLQERANLGDSSLNRIERGLIRPTVRALRLISAAFGMSVEEMLAQGAPGAEVIPAQLVEREHPAYYTCKQCHLNIRIDLIEPLIETLVLSEVGERVLLEKYIVHGDDHAADISRLERAAERRRELLADDPDDEDMARSLAATEAQIAELRRKPHEPDTPAWRPVESGIKVADHWAALDTAGRAKFLRDWEVTCFADREGAESRLGWLAIYGDAFKLSKGRLVPTALPVLVAHSQEWQRVPDAVLPALVAQATQEPAGPSKALPGGKHAAKP